jgi:DNA-binding IclR family transcriptional regulator
VQTERYAEIVDWVGRLGAAGAEHVMARFHMGRSWAYARLNRLVADGLLEQKQLLHRQAGLYVATAEGLRWRGLRRLGAPRISVGEHGLQVAARPSARLGESSPRRKAIG